MRKKLYTVYKKWQGHWLVATAANRAYRLYTGARLLRAAPPYGEPGGQGPRVALICDEMTWQDFRRECDAVFVTPRNWDALGKEKPPAMLFCESAWSGIRAYPDCWRGQIYRSDAVRYENRARLLRILEDCRRRGIPTAFWNKEDPAFFGNPRYDFVDTALRFDHIFTTAAECISGYRDRGHQSVHLLPFGVSGGLFGGEVPSLRERGNAAVFAGSWYADQPGRCRDMDQVFGMLLERGIPLVIYDRQWGSPNPVYRWPERFRPYLRPAVPFEELADIYRACRYGVNINTVTGSPSMFARRVLELMACGCVVVSNPSSGMEERFPGRVWVAGKPFDHSAEEAIALENRRDVLASCTVRARLDGVLQVAGVSSG